MNQGQGETVVVELKNIDMANMLGSLDTFLESATGKFGYAVARNLRKLNEACAEFLQIRQRLILELGEERKNENGNPTGITGIKIGSKEYKEYERKISEFTEILHSVEIYKIPYNLLPENITAKDMIALEWMLIDDGDYTC